MFLLNTDNRPFQLKFGADDSTNFCVLDYSNLYEIDFYWRPVKVVEQFVQTGVSLSLGPHALTLPLDWSIVICDRDHGLVETIEIERLGGRDFDAFALNPTGYMPSFLPISITGMLPSTTFTLPQVRRANLLAFPVQTCERPLCVFAIADGSKLPEELDIAKIFA